MTDAPLPTSGWRDDVPDFALLVRNMLGAIRRNLPVLVLGSLMMGALASALALTRPDYYHATSAIMIDPRLGGSGDAAAAPTIYLADALVVDSEIEVLRSDRLLGRVVTKLGPQIDAVFSDGAADDGAADDADAPLSAQERHEARIGWMGRNLTVERQGNTFVIMIGFTAEAPRLAALVANAIAEEYMLFQQDDSRHRVKQEAHWLSAEMARLSSEARQAEAAVQRFVVEHDVPKDGETGLVGATMADVEAEIVAQQRLLRSTALFSSQIEADIQRLQSEPVIGDLLSLRPDNQTLNRLMQQYKDAQRSDAGNDAVISRMGRQILNELTSMAEAAQATMQVTSANLERLEIRHSDLQAQLSRIAATQIELGNLQRASDAVMDQQRRVMEQLLRSESQDLYFISDTRIIDDAVPPAAPANPPLVLVAASGLFGGFLVALAWIFVTSQIDDRIRNPQALIDRLGLPYLGAIPPRPFHAQSLTHAHAISQDRSADGRQLYDSLRRSAAILRRDKGIALVISPGHDQDRAMLSASLASFLISQGEKVLLVECDATNRQLAALLGLGVKDRMPAGPSLDLVRPVEGLTIALPCPGPVDPAGYASAIQTLTAERQNNGGIIIIDGPSLSCAAEMVSSSQPPQAKVLLALPFGKVSLNTLGQALDRNPGIASHIHGVLLTDVTQRELRRHDPLLRRGTA